MYDPRPLEDKLSILDRSSAPRRVAFIHDTNSYGGMETLQIQVLKHLDRKRFTPFVLVPGYSDPHRSSPPRLIAEVEALGVPLLRPDPHGGRLVGAFREIAASARLIRNAAIDIAHIQTWHPEGARKATLAARLGRVRALVRSEHVPPAHDARRLRRYSVKLFDALTDHIVTVSDSARNDQIRLVGRKLTQVSVIHTGIDTSKYLPSNTTTRDAKIRIGLNPDLPVIGTVGRLQEEKGHRYLVMAIAQVLRDFGPAQCVLVGDGPLRSELEAEASRLALANTMRFVGFQSDPVPFIEAMDIAVMPSLWEGFSIAMQEFMALGKPLIVSDHGSFKEAIDHEVHGLVVPTCDSDGLARAITRLLSDPSLASRLGQSALERVRDTFSIQKHVAATMAIYDAVLGEVGSIPRQT